MRALLIGAVESTRIAADAIFRSPGWTLASIATLPPHLAHRHSDFVDLSAESCGLGGCRPCSSRANINSDDFLAQDRGDSPRHHLRDRLVAIVRQRLSRGSAPAGSWAIIRRPCPGCGVAASFPGPSCSTKRSRPPRSSGSTKEPIAGRSWGSATCTSRPTRPPGLALCQAHGGTGRSAGRGPAERLRATAPGRAAGRAFSRPGPHARDRTMAGSTGPGRRRRWNGWFVRWAALSGRLSPAMAIGA